MKKLNAFTHINSRQTPQGFITMESMTRDGIITNRRQYPIHSRVRNYWNAINRSLTATQTSFTRIDGTSTSGDNPVNNQTPLGHRGLVVSDEGDTWGIRVGAGDTPLVIDDHTLDEMIDHGTGEGELIHLETIAEAGATFFNSSRLFENLSGDTIQIREAAIVLGDSSRYNPGVMFARDVFDEAFPVPSGEIVTVRADMSAFEGGRNLNRMWEVYTNESGHEAGNIFYNRSGGTQILNARDRRVDTSVGDNLAGILLGTGVGETEFEMIDLVDRIEQGSGAGQLLYGATEVESITQITADGRLHFDVTRSIENDSGEDITITEMGLFSQRNSESFLLSRFLLPTPVVFANGATRTARWKFNYLI